jgi:hypothetical protein
MFPIIASHFLSHFVFGCGSTSMNIMVRGRGWKAKGIMTKHAIIFGGWEAYLGFYVGECPIFQKYW